MVKRQHRAVLHTVIAVAIIVGGMLAACSAPTPTPSVTMALSPAPTNSPGPTSTAFTPSVPPTTSPVIPIPTLTVPAVSFGLDAAPSPAFSGDQVTLRIFAFQVGGTSPGTETATVEFGDGSSATATGSCTAPVVTTHAYRQGGDYQARVTVVSGCAGASPANLADATTLIHVFPSAPATSASWPVCSTYQLHLAWAWSGVATGNSATQITLRNVSSRACTLDGYPDVVLVGAGGRLLPTEATPATTGAYMFPAVVPHRVALAPGDIASFMFAYANNPSGAGLNEPFDVACPIASGVRVILPGTHEFGTALFPLAPCEGWILVSSIVPGANRLTF